MCQVNRNKCAICSKNGLSIVNTQIPPSLYNNLIVNVVTFRC